MSQTYKIAVPKNLYRSLISSSKPSQRANGRILPSTCLDNIIHLMIAEEHTPLLLKCKNPYIYPTFTRVGSVFIRIHGYCPQCQFFANDKETKNGTYLILAEHNPLNQDEPRDPEKDADFVECTVSHSLHVHEKTRPVVATPAVKESDNETNSATIGIASSSATSIASSSATSIASSSATSIASSSATSIASSSQTEACSESDDEEGEEIDDHDICSMQLRGQERIDAVIAIVQT